MQRRLATAISAALMAVLLVVGTALAGHGHATGGGKFTYLAVEQLDFEAHDYGVASPRDRGTAHYRNITSGQGIEYTAEIVCASVTPDKIQFGYIIPENASTIGNNIAGLSVIWVVTDGGSPGTGNDSAYYVYEGQPGAGQVDAFDCDAQLPPFPASNVLNGNFTVHEARD